MAIDHPAHLLAWAEGYAAGVIGEPVSTYLDIYSLDDRPTLALFVRGWKAGRRRRRKRMGDPTWDAQRGEYVSVPI